MNEGVSHFKSKEYEKAVASFQRAVAIDPEYSEARLDLGLTYMELYEPGSEHPKDMEYAEGAIQAFREYSRLEPENEKAREYLINVCKLSRRMQDAIDFYMVDYEKNQNDLKMVRTMMALYRMAGQTDQAIDFSQKAAELDPDNPEAHYSVGVACWGRSYHSMSVPYEERMALLDTGLASLERALVLKEDYYDALTYMNLIYREKAKYDISPAATVVWRQKADELLTKAMELRNAALAAQAAEAAGSRSDSPDAAPASTGGEH